MCLGIYSLLLFFNLNISVQCFLYLEDLKDSVRKLRSNKAAEYKTNIQKSSALYILITRNQRGE